MGQKVNPIGYRLGVNKTWQSKWYSKDNYQEYLINDIKIREYLEKNLKIKGVYLPSTSPANAKYKLDDLVKSYEIIKNIDSI